MVFTGVTRSIGTIFVYILGAIIPWYYIAYFATIFPLLSAMLLLYSPESPVHLVSKGKMAIESR